VTGLDRFHCTYDCSIRVTAVLEYIKPYAKGCGHQLLSVNNTCSNELGGVALYLSNILLRRAIHTGILCSYLSLHWLSEDWSGSTSAAKDGRVSTLALPGLQPHPTMTVQLCTRLVAVLLVAQAL